MWLEYYDKEHDCNYYQHSVTKEKVWTVEEIDAAEEESKHSVSVSFSREMKSSSSSPSPSPKRRDSTSRLLPTTKGRSSASSSPRSARSSPRSSSKKKMAAGSLGENRENQQTRNTPSSVVSDDNDNEGEETEEQASHTVVNRRMSERSSASASDSDSDSDSSSSSSDSDSDNDNDNDDTTISLNRPTPHRLKRSVARSRTGNREEHAAVALEVARDSLDSPSKNTLRDGDTTTTTLHREKGGKIQKKSRKRHQQRRGTSVKVRDDNQFDHDGSVTFAMYTFMVFFHGALCESPAAALECLVRSVLALFRGVVHALAYAARRNATRWDEAIFQFREFFICLCTFPSLLLLLPGGLVYRRFDSLEPWSVSTIWTIAGRVDPRRFSAFTFGQGSDAINVLSNQFPCDAMDDLPMPSLTSGGGSSISSKYRRVSIGDGVPSDLKRRSQRRKTGRLVKKSRSDTRRKRKKRGGGGGSSGSSGSSGSHQRIASSDSEISDSSDEYSSTESESSSSIESEEDIGRYRDGLHEVVLELPPMVARNGGSTTRRGEERSSGSNTKKWSRV